MNRRRIRLLAAALLAPLVPHAGRTQTSPEQPPTGMLRYNRILNFVWCTNECRINPNQPGYCCQIVPTGPVN